MLAHGQPTSQIIQPSGQFSQATGHQAIHPQSGHSSMQQQHGQPFSTSNQPYIGQTGRPNQTTSGQITNQFGQTQIALQPSGQFESHLGQNSPQLQKQPSQESYGPQSTSNNSPIVQQRLANSTQNQNPMASSPMPNMYGLNLVKSSSNVVSNNSPANLQNHQQSVQISKGQTPQAAMQGRNSNIHQQSSIPYQNVNMHHQTQSQNSNVLPKQVSVSLQGQIPSGVPYQGKKSTVMSNQTNQQPTVINTQLPQSQNLPTHVHLQNPAPSQSQHQQQTNNVLTQNIETKV